MWNNCPQSNDFGFLEKNSISLTQKKLGKIDTKTKKNFPLLLDVQRCGKASYEITRPSVCPSLRFLKIGSLVFSNIVHDDSWPWYLVADKARFLKKKIGGKNLGQIGQNRNETRIFPIFQVWFINLLKLLTVIACYNL